MCKKHQNYTPRDPHHMGSGPLLINTLSSIERALEETGRFHVVLQNDRNDRVKDEPHVARVRSARRVHVYSLVRILTAVQELSLDKVDGRLELVQALVVAHIPGWLEPGLARARARVRARARARARARVVGHVLAQRLRSELLQEEVLLVEE